MKTFANKDELPSRIRFMLQDVEELRNNSVSEILAVWVNPLVAIHDTWLFENMGNIILVMIDLFFDLQNAAFIDIAKTFNILYPFLCMSKTGHMFC
jgi:hypothetical protein